MLDPATGRQLRASSGRAREVSNDSATIEAQGRVRIDSVLLNNRNIHLEIGVQQEAPTYEELIAPTWSDMIFKAGYCSNLQATTSSCQEPADQGGRSLVFEDYTIYRINGYPSRSVVKRTAPSVLRAGGDLQISGDGSSDSKVLIQDSQLMAGGLLALDATSLDNIATTGTYRVDYSGNYQHSSVETCGRGHCREWQMVGDYSPAPLIQTIALPTVAGLPSSTPTENGQLRAGQLVASVPDNALFKPSSNLNYLIETDPAFANYRNWLSSDYILNAMAVDPAQTQKRLGDGFYEQKLLREQAAQVTGRRFLDGYGDDETEYLALMRSGVTFAQAHQLVPGIGLSAEQMTQLTSDIVWLVEQEVMVSGADGKPVTTKVLVPRLYVMAQPGDLDGSGGLLSGDSVQAELGGNVLNSATIAGRKLVRLGAQDIVNTGSVQGADVDLQAKRDVRVQGGTVVADNSLRVQAGRDLQVANTTIESQTEVSAADAAHGASFTRTGLDRVASLYVTGKGSTASGSDTRLQLSAGRNVDITGAAIGNAGAAATQISAGQDLKLGSVTTSVDNRAVAGGNGGESLFGSFAAGLTGATDSQNYSRSLIQQEQGSSIQTHGDIRLSAGQDINLRAANVSSESGAIQLQSGRDLSIANGENRQSRDDQHHYSSSGSFSSSTTTLREGYDRTTAVASTLSGKSLTAAAGQDLSVVGSSIVADGDVQLSAARDLTIAAAKETRSQVYNFQENKSGLMGSGGFGVSLGTRDVAQDNKAESTGAASALVGSIQGTVNIQAGRKYAQTGSDVLAPAGDVNINASQVSIAEARETSHTSMQSRVEQSGVTLALSNPVVTAVQTAEQMKEAADNSSGSRMKALALANTVLVAERAARAVQAGQGTTIDGKPNQIPTGKTTADGKAETRDATVGDQIGGVDLAISFGSASSQSSFESASNTSRASTVTAGRDVKISASGEGKDSSLLVQGSQIVAGSAARLSAQGDLQLQAANNSATMSSRDSSSSASVGVSIGTSGLLVTASASRGRGNADSSDSAWTPTQVQAGQQADLQSGGDTVLRGATVSAPRVTADVAAKLNIESLQDTSQYNSDQKSVGASIGVGAGQVRGNIAYNSSKVDSRYAGVAEQSGIKAGDNGFDVKVGQDAVLTGGVITSTQRAVDEGKNRYQAAGTTTLTDITNSASYSANSVGINVGTGFDPAGKLAPSGTGIGIGHDGDQTQSVSRAAISGIAGNKEARTGDADAALPRIFDAERVQKEVNAQVQITQTFGREATRAVADYASAQEKAARRRGDTAEADKWKEGGAYRVVLQTAVGGLTGGAAAAAGAGTVSALAPKLDELQSSVAAGLKAAGASDAVASGASALLANVAAAGVGAVVGGGSAAAVAGAVNVDANNRQLHPDETNWILKNAKTFAKQSGISEEEAISRLTQQALRQVDYLWRAQLSDGDDTQAKAFLKTNDSFTNDLGQRQPLFTTTGQQLFRPEMFADTADPAFTRQYVQSGIERSISTGLIKEMKDSGIDIGNAAVDLARAVRDNPKAVVSAVWSAVTEMPAAIRDSFIESGKLLGESSAVVLNGELTDKLNALYGADVQLYQQTLFAIRLISTVAGATAVSDAGVALAEGTTKAILSTVDDALKKISSNPVLVSAQGRANAVTYAGLKLDLKTTEAANEVVESLRNTGQLPSNYVTKNQAYEQGWQQGKPLDNFLPGGQIGGDVFKNADGLLPSAPGRVWYEADVGVNTTMARRSSEQPASRLLYSSDGLLYVTSDHYSTMIPIGRWKN